MRVGGMEATATDKIFVLKIKDAPTWLNTSNLAIALRNYFESGYEVQEVFNKVEFEDEGE